MGDFSEAALRMIEVKIQERMALLERVERVLEEVLGTDRVVRGLALRLTDLTVNHFRRDELDSFALRLREAGDTTTGLFLIDEEIDARFDLARKLV